MGAGRALSDALAGAGWAAGTQLTRGVQRPALRGEDRRALALDAKRLAALGGGVSADATLAGGRLLRGAGRGPSSRAAACRGEKGAAQRCHPGQPDLALHAGERAGYDGAKRKKGSKLHLAVDTLGHL